MVARPKNDKTLFIKAVCPSLNSMAGCLEREAHGMKRLSPPSARLPGEESPCPLLEAISQPKPNLSSFTFSMNEPHLPKNPDDSLKLLLICPLPLWPSDDQVSKLPVQPVQPALFPCHKAHLVQLVPVYPAISLPSPTCPWDPALGLLEAHPLTQTCHPLTQTLACHQALAGL